MWKTPKKYIEINNWIPYFESKCLIKYWTKIKTLIFFKCLIWRNQIKFVFPSWKLHNPTDIVHPINLRFVINICMITVVEFRAKQATGSRYMPTDKLYANYFFIKIYLDWSEHAKNWARFQKTECFKNENNQKVSWKFF